MNKKSNAHWDLAIDTFTLSMEIAGAQAGEELTEEYCSHCSNVEMMAVWGIFLEDNVNAIQKTDTSFCHSTSNSESESNLTRSQSSVSLRKVTEAMLDMKSTTNSNWRAPRCQAEAVVTSEQGPLRCSMARLAWEHCHAEWNRPDAVNVVQRNLRGKSNANQIDEDFVTLISQSFIGAVHPKLLHGNTTKSRFGQPPAARGASSGLHRSINQGGMTLSAARRVL